MAYIGCWSSSSNFRRICDETNYVHWIIHDDVIKWKNVPRYWPFVRGIHRSPVKSPHKGQWRGALMFPLICFWINGWVNNREAGDSRRYRSHYDVTVMILTCLSGPVQFVLANSIESLHSWPCFIICYSTKSIDFMTSKPTKILFRIARRVWARGNLYSTHLVRGQIAALLDTVF